jgi:hypothetical protein
MTPSTAHIARFTNRRMSRTEWLQDLTEHPLLIADMARRVNEIQT